MSKHSLVIGGTKGLGREVVNQLISRGDTVSVFGRSVPSVPSQNAVYFPLDITRTEELKTTVPAMLAKQGPINNLIFLQRYKGNENKWQGEIDTSLTATNEIIELLVPGFETGTDNSIVIVSSIADTFISDSQPASYHLGKAGLLQLTRHYAVSLGPKGIRVNCVSPCTFIKDENRDFYRSNDKLTNLFKKTIPLGRMGTSQDTANLITFLCSANASFLTGQRISVDGGVSLISQEALARKIAQI